MNDYLKKLKNHPAYSLSVSERQAMRATLEQLTARSVLQSTHISSSWFVHLMRPAPLAAFALILAVSTSSVSLAADSALPGDILYGVKRGVNERLEVALAPTTEARAVAHVRQVEERLEEVEVLAAQSALTPSVAEAAAESLGTQIQTAERAVSDLETEGDIAAAGNVQNRIAVALSAHAELLFAHAENFDGESHETLKALALVAQDTAGLAEAADSGALSEEHERLSEDAARARAKESLARLHARVEDADLPPETIESLTQEHAQLTARLEASDLLIAENPETAFAEYEDIDRLAYRALTFLESASRIAQESSKEVVVELASAPVVEPGPVALRAKSAEPEEAATLMMASDASSSEAADTSLMMQATMPAPAVIFQLRDRSAP